MQSTKHHATPQIKRRNKYLMRNLSVWGWNHVSFTEMLLQNSLHCGSWQMYIHKWDCGYGICKHFCLHYLPLIIVIYTLHQLFNTLLFVHRHVAKFTTKLYVAHWWSVEFLSFDKTFCHTFLVTIFICQFI